MGIFFKNTCPLCWDVEGVCNCNPKDIAEYERKRVNGELKVAPPPVNDNSIKNLFPFDIVCKFDELTGKASDEFFVKKIENSKVYGVFMDNRNDGKEEELPYTNWKKLYSTVQK